MLSRPQTVLLDGHALRLPVEGGWHIESHPEGVVVGEISRLLVFGVVLRTRSAAAGALRRLVAEWLGSIQAHRILIAGLILLRIQRTDNLIVQRALDVVEILRIVRLITVQILGQLDEIVGAAGFVDVGISLRFALLQAVGCHAQNLRIGLAEHLAVAYATHRIHVSALHQTPEVLSQIVIIWLLIALVTAQGSDNHRDVLVSMTGADVVDVPAQRVEELRRIKAVGCLEELRLLIRIGNHLGKSGERFAHSSHLSGYVHVPHLVSVARLGSALILVAILLHVSAIMHSVPHPEPHVLGYEKCLVADFLVIKIGGYVDESCQLLVYAVVRRPHPVAVVVGTIHLYQGAMLSRNGVDVAVAILLRMLLVFIKGSPGALHLSEFSLGSEISRLPVAVQILVEHEGFLLALAQFVHHAGDVFAEDGLLFGLGCHGVRLCDGRHVVARTMPLEFGIRRIPAVASGVALGAQCVGIPIVVELLTHVPGADFTDCLVAVVGESVVAVDSYIGEREGVHHLVQRNLIPLLHYLYLSLDRIAVVGGFIADDESAYLILASCGMLLRIRLSLFVGKRSVRPAHLSILRVTIRIGYPHQIGESWNSALRAIHSYRSHLRDGAIDSGRRHGSRHGCSPCYSYY